MRPSRPVAFWGILALQLAVPLVQLGADRPSRFGWHMYSAIGDPSTFGVVRTDGTVDTTRVDEVLIKWRPEIDVASIVPPRLCEIERDAVAVRRYPALRPGDVQETRCP